MLLCRLGLFRALRPACVSKTPFLLVSSLVLSLSYPRLASRKLAPGNPYVLGLALFRLKNSVGGDTRCGAQEAPIGFLSGGGLKPGKVAGTKVGETAIFPPYYLGIWLGRRGASHLLPSSALACFAVSFHLPFCRSCFSLAGWFPT